MGAGVRIRFRYDSSGVPKSRWTELVRCPFRTLTRFWPPGTKKDTVHRKKPGRKTGKSLLPATGNGSFDINEFEDMGIFEIPDVKGEWHTGRATMKSTRRRCRLSPPARKRQSFPSAAGRRKLPASCARQIAALRRELAGTSIQLTKIILSGQGNVETATGRIKAAQPVCAEPH